MFSCFEKGDRREDNNWSSAVKKRLTVRGGWGYVQKRQSYFPFGLISNFLHLFLGKFCNNYVSLTRHLDIDTTF